MDSRKAPIISVIMPVYNAERYLYASVESILNQSFTDFEFLIVNDGSTDQTTSILQGFSDPRIKIITQTKSGLVPSLNRLLDQAQGKYIARMDADDESTPSRLEEQLLWFQHNPKGILVGSWTTIINADGNQIKQARYPVTDSFCKITLASGNAFAHGSVMFRRGEYRYREEYNFAEDYDLWRRLATQGKIGNIPLFLYHWRTHGESISHQNIEKQNAIDQKIQREHRESHVLPEYAAIANDTPQEVNVRGRLRVINSLLRLVRIVGVSKLSLVFQLKWLALRILVGYRTQ